jgi:hypothetical protein
MDIKQVREEKARVEKEIARVEKEIARILNEFNEKTELVILDLELTPVYQGVNQKVISTYVRARIEL